MRIHATLQAILAYKQAHDGISPSLAELATQLDLVKSKVHQHIVHLMDCDLLYKTPGQSRNLAVTGGEWQWANPRPYPAGRAGDVLREVVAYKRTHDGNAPSHREIAAVMELAYTSSIKGYLDALAETGYLAAAYATDRHICVAGGVWRYSKDVLAQASPDFYSQGTLLSLD